ncbi:GIY-YIG nuclease family protein [Niabella drilacis]|uniref:Putative endonuclease n=1 Tax=Niabella drilacis (strain DSM 25811 / CCM 8410 / CCUG 62505 / LMG 26954 / E90) TaxID=1285928 RepID=A0A1G6IUE0_NIADE|nr:GIY-YIG nuclease family protein [Niabella drilacis]SDC10030.1 putative endonuclease [Niabella drilacis]
MKKGGFIYILTNKLKTVLYIGVTSNLRRRIWEHAHHENENSFTDQYNVTGLVYYEWFDVIVTAIEREKQLKRWSRTKKVALIKVKNPEWRLLNEEVYDEVYSLLY